jgi:hypothetical protein
MKQLTQKHGYDVWAPIKEFLEAYQVPKQSPYCTESDGTEHYWQGDPHYLANLHAAWNVLNGSIKCKERDLSRPTIFFFDGHKDDRMAGVVPFLSGLAPLHASVYGTARNELEHIICKVKDCFGDYGYPVVGDGIRSDLCFKRRQGEPDDYKVYLNPDHLKDTSLGEVWPHKVGQLAVELSKHGSVFGDFPAVTYEDATAFEFTNDTGAFQASLNSWAELIRGIGITPDHGILEEHLKNMIDSRASHSIREEIYNFEEVKEYLGTAARFGYIDSLEQLARLDHETIED